MGPLLLLTLLLIAAPASAEYFVEATGNVGFGETGSYQEGAFTEVDGPTSGSITVDQRYVDPVSGAVSSMYTTAEANLATGALRIYGTALGAEGQIITHAYFHDDVTFHLPEGMEISTIRGSLTIHGFEHGEPLGKGMINLGGWAASTFLVDLSTILGQSIDVNRTVTDGETVRISASMEAQTAPDLTTRQTFELQNTALFSLDVPEGVTFTSDSGVFLTKEPAAVPVPAIGIIGTAVLIATFGALGLKRRGA